MKCIIAGSRGITDLEIVKQVFAECPFSKDITEIVSGCARGVDSLGEELAKLKEIPVKRFPAQWDKYGKSAGYRRNEEMARYSDVAIVVWDGVSRGSSHMIDIMKRIEKPFFVKTVK